MKKIAALALVFSLPVISMSLLSGCLPVPTPEQQLQSLESGTGFRPVTIDGASADYLEKVHRGYRMLLRIKMGNVWGRYVARVTAGEVGRELGGIWSFLTGSYRSGVGGVTGSPFDRLLSDMIGQPISISVIADHHKPRASRADIYSMFSNIKPYDPQPEIQYIGLGPGTLYAADSRYAQRVLAEAELVERLKNFRSQYIRVDDRAVSFIFAGSENDYSGMIRDSGGYQQLINAIADSLADMADKI